MLKEIKISCYSIKSSLGYFFLQMMDDTEVVLNDEQDVFNDETFGGGDGKVFNSSGSAIRAMC